MNVRSTAVVLFAVVLFAVTSHGEYYCGEMNSWGATAMSQDAFGDTWNVTITADGADSVSEFKFDQDGAAPLDWGVFAAATKNATIGYLASTGGSISFVELDTNCYTFRMNPAHTQYVIMETSTDPVTIAGIDDDSDERYTNAVSVFISLSGAPSAAEAVWVCYTTNAWATRQFVAATGSASSCTALIPAQTADTMVEYYVLTSTMPQPVLESNYDLCTLKGDNNGGTNYAYTCPATCYWRDGAANNKWHNTSTWPWRYGIFRRWVPANYSILRVDNNNQAGDWDQNKTGLIVHRLYFGSGASSARTITGQTLTFAGIFCLDPYIQNESTAAHVLNVAINVTSDEPLNINAAAGNLTCGNAVNNGGQRIIATAAAGKTLTFAGAIAGAGGLVKNGAGALVLAGLSSYSGATAINAGTLAGTGSVASSAVTVHSGARVAPGPGIGALTTGNLAMQAGTHYDWDYSNTTSDWIGAQALTLPSGAGTANSVTIAVSRTEFVTYPITRPLFTYSSFTAAQTNALYFNLAAVAADELQPPTLTFNGTSLLISLVPEPAGWLGLIALALARRFGFLVSCHE